MVSDTRPGLTLTAAAISEDERLVVPARERIWPRIAGVIFCDRFGARLAALRHLNS